jgi:hypothetical protein
MVTEFLSFSVCSVQCRSDFSFSNVIIYVRLLQLPPSLARVHGMVHRGISMGEQLCHGTGSYVFASHCEGSGSVSGQCMWALRWTHEHWNRFFSKYFGFPVNIISSNAAQSFIHPSLTPNDLRNCSVVT